VSLPFTVIPSRHCGRCSRSLLGLVAEAGPEAIIPLSVGMRSRALALYEETGRRLGVRPYAKDWTSGKWDEIKTVWETAKVSFAADREAGQRAAAIQYAIGGILTRPHLGMVAEAGPEAIIPLSARMRARAMDLWLETGRRLGVRPYAMGDISVAVPAAAGFGIPASSATISVVNHIDVTVGGSNADPDDIAKAIAIKIEKVFRNMAK
jgi:hypothetical protein